MSRPFSSEYTDAKIATEEELDHNYAVAGMVWNMCEWKLLATSLKANNPKRAKEKARKWIYEQFPECAGYLRHKVVVHPID